MPSGGPLIDVASVPLRERAGCTCSFHSSRRPAGRRSWALPAISLLPPPGPQAQGWSGKCKSGHRHRLAEVGITLSPSARTGLADLTPRAKVGQTVGCSTSPAGLRARLGSLRGWPLNCDVLPLNIKGASRFLRKWPLATLDIEPPEALWPETKGQAASLARVRGHPLQGAGITGQIPGQLGIGAAPPRPWPAHYGSVPPSRHQHPTTAACSNL